MCLNEKRDEVKEFLIKINALGKNKEQKLEWLEKEFNFHYEKNDENWVFKIIPKEQEKTAELISFVVIQGSDYINKIKIQMKNGTITTIWFEK